MMWSLIKNRDTIIIAALIYFIMSSQDQGLLLIVGTTAFRILTWIKPHNSFTQYSLLLPLLPAVMLSSLNFTFSQFSPKILSGIKVWALSWPLQAMVQLVLLPFWKWTLNHCPAETPICWSMCLPLITLGQFETSMLMLGGEPRVWPTIIIM